MVLTGSCMCGKIKYQADAEPAVKAVCHCLNCQKFSGSAFTTNFIIPRSSFKILSEMMSIKAGSLDDGAARLEGGHIDAEAFVQRRVAYLKPLEGASQVNGMIQA
ncbi:Glutathione-dependent formaldehyde-activating enzyme/centromere protein V [Penicillium freii]|nr:Glutathione-dependent formaldehyde-activating enzyme/centromere protein V [Penicillium freii]